MELDLIAEEGLRFDEPLAALTGTPGVQGSLVATEDGLPLAVRLRRDRDPEALSAAAAAMGRISQRALAALDRGDLELSVLDADQFRLMVSPLSLGFLMVVAEPDANLGLIAADMSTAVEALERAAVALGAPPRPASGGAP